MSAPVRHALLEAEIGRFVRAGAQQDNPPLLSGHLINQAIAAIEPDFVPIGTTANRLCARRARIFPQLRIGPRWPGSGWGREARRVRVQRILRSGFARA